MNETTEYPKIAVIGGGTGSFTLLQELKQLTPEITALVNMSDDGGSTGRLRDELGVLPPGDVRQCLVALSDAPEMRDVFTVRFGEEDGPFRGHSLGNIILAGLEREYGDFTKAVKAASSILRITGRVVPVTLDSHTLVMDDDGEITRGEYTIGHLGTVSKSARLFHDPATTINPEAAEAICESNMLVLAPGNLYGSIIPALATGGLREVVRDSQAPIVMVANLVNKPGQTDGWHVADYVQAIERYLGDGAVDSVLYNNSPPSEELLNKYAAQGELPVRVEDEAFQDVEAVPKGAPLIASEIHVPHVNDKELQRTLIRHDAKRVAQEIKELLHGRE